VIAFYAVSGGYAYKTIREMSGNWSRKATLHIFGILSTYWMAFYIWLLASQFGAFSPPFSLITLLSRLGHYFTAAGFFVIIAFLSMVNRKYTIVPLGAEDNE
jgi:hypothetical protein